MSSARTKRYDAFLSYNSQDRQAVDGVAERLRGEGLELYLEEWELAPGREFQPALAEGLRDSKTCVVFLGPNGLGPWQKQELQVAIDKRVRDEAFHVIPVLLPGAERPRRGDVAHLEFLINASWVEFLKTLDDERAFRSSGLGDHGDQAPAAGRDAVRGGLPVSRPGGVPARRREVLLRPREPDRLAGQRPAARGAGGAGGAVPGRAGAVGQRQVVGGAGRAGAEAEGGGDRGERALAGRDPAAGGRPAEEPGGRGRRRGSCPPAPRPTLRQVLKLADDLRADERTLDVFAADGPARPAGGRAAGRGGGPVRGGLHLPAAGRPGAGAVRAGPGRVLRQPPARGGHAGGPGGGRPDDAVGLPERLCGVPAARRGAQRPPGAGRADDRGGAARGDRAAGVPASAARWSRA